MVGSCSFPLEMMGISPTWGYFMGFSMGVYGNLMGSVMGSFMGIYPLVNIHKTMENHRV